MTSPDKKRVLVLGGYGVYGSIIVEHLKSAPVDLVTVGRNEEKGRMFAKSQGVDFLMCDVTDAEALREAVSGAFLVINASGPFQAQDYTIPRVCIEQGCHYIDLGDGRNYVAQIGRLHQDAIARDVFVCAGASTTPAITSAMLAALDFGGESLRSVKVALNAGNKNQAGVSTFASILAYAGAPVRVWQDNRWKESMGWSMGEFVEFPPPVGRRIVYLCDVPDLELIPRNFDVETVVFKAGVEITLFDYALAFLAHLRRWSILPNLPTLAKPLVQLSGLFKFFGTFHGGLAIWAESENGVQKSIALVAPENGPQIPAAPAVLLARQVIDAGAPASGAFPCVGFVDLAAYEQHLAPFGITLSYGEDGKWRH